MCAHHEVWDQSVEDDIVILALLREHEEVVTCLRGLHSCLSEPSAKQPSSELTCLFAKQLEVQATAEGRHYADVRTTLANVLLLAFALRWVRKVFEHELFLYSTL